jgi:hypothetical protein
MQTPKEGTIKVLLHTQEESVHVCYAAHFIDSKLGTHKHTHTHTHTHTKAPLTFEDVLLACIAKLLDCVQNESSRLSDAHPCTSNSNTPRLLIHIDVTGRHRLSRQEGHRG